MLYWAVPGDSAVKNPPSIEEPQETRIQSLGWEDLMEKGMATHSRILAWEIPWTEEPNRLQYLCWGQCERSKRDSILKPVIHLKDKV